MRRHVQTGGGSVLLALAASAVASSPLQAHGFGAHDAGLLGGLAHPLLGADHLLAVLAVGLLASQAARGRRVRAPVAFVAATAAGFAVAAAGAVLPFLETALLASVLGLGALVAIEATAGGAVLAVVAAFGVLHGVGHGAELSGAALPAGLGLVAATAALHGIGLGLGTALRRLAGSGLVRASGAAVAALGVLAFLA